MGSSDESNSILGQIKEYLVRFKNFVLQGLRTVKNCCVQALQWLKDFVLQVSQTIKNCCVQAVQWLKNLACKVLQMLKNVFGCKGPKKGNDSGGQDNVQLKSFGGISASWFNDDDEVCRVDVTSELIQDALCNMVLLLEEEIKLRTE